MYGKLINNYLYYAPKNFTTDTGEIIVNFDKNIDLMKQYGYKEVIKEPPKRENFKQEVVIEGYEETEDTIIAKYIIIDKRTIKTLDQRVSTLENGINEIMMIFDEEVNK